MNVLVTGARGFIGKVVCQHLFSHGMKVCGVGHGQAPTALLATYGLQYWRQGEVDSANLDDIASRIGPISHVVHLAGGSTVGASMSAPLEDFHRTCSTSTQLLEWVRQRSPQTRILVVSSAAVYGVDQEAQITEESVTTPQSPYGTHKLVMEMLCRSYATNFGIQAVILRLFSVYGSGLRKQLLWDICSSLAADGYKKLGGTGREVRDWINVLDAAELIRLALDSASTACPTLNGGTGIGTSVSTIAAEICEHWPGAQIEFSGLRRAGDPLAQVADITRARQLGFAPSVDIKSGLRSYVNWFRAGAH